MKKTLVLRSLAALLLAGCSQSQTHQEFVERNSDHIELFNGTDLSGWKITPEVEAHWEVRDGTIAFDGRRGDLWSEESFENFELLVDWRWVGPSQGTRARQIIEPDGSYQIDEEGQQITRMIEERDRGIYLRGNAKSQVNIWEWPAGSGEVWGYRTDGSMPAETRAAATPIVRADRPVHDWNTFRILLSGDLLNVHLNGVQVISNCRLPGVPAHGPVGLQAHGSAIEFRNLLIRRLD